ncbi:MAG: prepilin-type N-terminal cleavage/methylation domain-containing protein [Patescibacteria group bacterium]
MENFRSYFLNKFSLSRSVVKSTRGFTIIETLVAIAVLMIAIAGPLVIATKGLTSALYAKDQMIASFLARESMEVIRNKKANNASIDLSIRLSDLVASGNCDSSANICDAGVNSSMPDGIDIMNPCGLGPPKGCRLYYDSTKGYTHDGSSGTPTRFYRYYYIENTTRPNDERTVHVFVEWNEGTIPYQIEMTNQITNIRR